MEQLRAAISARNQELKEDEIDAFANQVVRETVQTMKTSGKVVYNA